MQFLVEAQTNVKSSALGVKLDSFTDDQDQYNDDYQEFGYDEVPFYPNYYKEEEEIVALTVTKSKAKNRKKKGKKSKKKKKNSCHQTEVCENINANSKVIKA